MTIGGSIFIIAVGAILRYAIEDSLEGVDLQTIGLILMIAGVVGLVLGLFLMQQARSRGDVVYERERRDPPPPGY
jgi:hypothetical protein